MKILKAIPIALLVGSLLSACMSQDTNENSLISGLKPKNFTAVYRGDSLILYTLRNALGMEVCITNFGGRIVSISVPDKTGAMKDVVLGFDSIQAYYPENNLSDFGAAIGRYANRINQGKFILDQKEYQLPRNNFGHCLHGGAEMGDRGWQYRAYQVTEHTDSTLTLSIDAPDGDNGFPGHITANVKYTLREDNVLCIDYSAITDAPTIINMTNHSYFNLSGVPSHPVIDHLLAVNANGFTPVDTTFMTTGEILPVEGTPMDFRKEKVIGQDIERMDYAQIKNANGYDHNWVLSTNQNVAVEAASVYCPSTGILLQVYTDEPGIQIYTGNFLDGTTTGKYGIKYRQHAGVCLETQHYPDSPNNPEWPSTVLRPGEKYSSRTVYKFSIR